MDLEELKDLWKKNDANVRPRDAAEILSMLKGNSKSLVSKIKRNVWIELVFTLAAGIALLLFALTLSHGALKYTSISILVAFVIYTGYYVKKLILLSHFDVTTGNIRSNLEALIEKLSTYLRYYRLSYTVLYPIYFIIGVVFGGLARGYDEFLEILQDGYTLLSLAALALLFYFASTWLVKWLLRKMYGNHLDKLRSILRDLEE